jgi:transposase
LLDAGCVDAELLVTAQSRHRIEVVGLLSANAGWQSRAATGYGLEAFELDWEAQQARCPQGSHGVRWTPGHDVSGDPVVRIRFHGPTCRACEVRPRGTAAKDQPRQLTVRPQAQHEAIQAARQRQETEVFKARYALRAGVESSLSQGVRRFDRRRSRSIG